MIQSVLIPLIRFLCDTLLTVWFLRNLTDYSIRKQIRAIPVLLITLPLYYRILLVLFSANPFQSLIRFLIRAAAVYFYLILGRKEKSRSTLPQAVYFTLVFFTVQNFFMTPVLRYFRSNGIPLLKNADFNLILALIAEYMIRFLIMHHVCRKVDLAEIQSEKPSAILLYLGLVILQIYIRGFTSSLGATFRLGENLYAILILIISLGNTVFLESNQITFRQKHQMEFQNYLYQEQAEHFRKEIEQDNHVRELRHDLKNHLIAIKTLADDPVRIKNYINKMLDTLEQTEPDIETGNKLVNGLIGHKISEANIKNIRIKCYADFTCLSGMNDADLSVILGNALDNALEAADKISDPARRCIRLKTGELANMFFIRIENYYEEEPIINSNTFISTKNDSLLHGYGIRQIRNTVSKYDGTCSFEQTDDHVFRLVISLPLPEKTS